MTSDKHKHSDDDVCLLARGRGNLSLTWSRPIANHNHPINSPWKKKSFQEAGCVTIGKKRLYHNIRFILTFCVYTVVLYEIFLISVIKVSCVFQSRESCRRFAPVGVAAVLWLTLQHHVWTKQFVTSRNCRPNWKIGASR